MSTADFAGERRRLSDNLEKGLAAMREEGAAYARTENAYRRTKREAWRRIPGDLTLAKEREAWVEAETADARMLRDLANMSRQDALEAVRSRRSQLSALQTELNADIEEAKFIRTGQDA